MNKLLREKFNYPLWVRAIFLFEKQKYGKVLNPLFAWGRISPLLLPFLMSIRQFKRSTALSAELRNLISLRISQLNQCEFCYDINAMEYFERNGNTEKALAVSNFETSLLYTDTEKLALTYCEQLTRTDLNVDVQLAHKLKEQLGEQGLLTLCAWIGFQNMSAKFNTGMNISSQGFCDISQQKKQNTQTDK